MTNLKLPTIETFTNIFPHSGDFVDYVTKPETELTSLPLWQEINELAGDHPESIFKCCGSAIGHWSFFFFFQQNNITKTSFLKYRKHIKDLFGGLPIIKYNGDKLFDRLKRAHSDCHIDRLPSKGMEAAVINNKPRAIANFMNVFKKKWKNTCPSLFKCIIDIENYDESSFNILLKYDPPQNADNIKKLLIAYFSIRAIYNIKNKNVFYKKLSPIEIKAAAKKALKLSNKIKIKDDLKGQLKIAKRKGVAPQEKFARTRDAELEGNARIFSAFRLEKYISMTKRLLSDYDKIEKAL